MAKFDLKAVLSDVKAYRQVYFLTVVASFGGMLFGWDTGLIGMRQDQAMTTGLANHLDAQAACSQWMLSNTLSI